MQHVSHVFLPPLLLAFFLMALPHKGVAETTLTPSLVERVSWSDNLFLKDLEAVELRSEPALSAKHKNERLNVNAVAKLSDYRYFDTKTNIVSGEKVDSDRYDRTTYQLNTGASFQSTERLNLSLGGGWLRDYSVDTFWDTDYEQKTLLRRDTYNGNAGFEYKLTEKDTVSLNFSYATLEYAKRIASFADYDMMNSSLYWQHSLMDGLMSLVAQASWQHVKFDSPEQVAGYFAGIFPVQLKQDVTQDVYSGMAGILWQPEERLSMQLMGGVNYTKSKVETKNTSFFYAEESTKHYSNTGFTGMADIAWSEKNSTGKLSVKQEFMPSTYGELRKTTSATLSHNYSYTPRINLYSSIAYTKSKSDDISTNNINREFWRFSIQPSYKLAEDFYLSLNYAYVYYDNKGDNYISRSNTIFLQLSYEFPKTF